MSIKEIKKYTLTVEGETEKWYFEWLQKLINNTDTAQYKVKLDISIQQYPLSYIKRKDLKSTPFIVHICDVESNSTDDQNKFKNILSELNKAKKQKKIQYRLGYSNFTFELWMILHKQDYNTSLTDRSQYLKPINCSYNEQFIDLKTYKREDNFKRCLSKLNLTSVKDAIKRSEKIMQNNRDNKKREISHDTYRYFADNPSLTIWKIVKEIINDCVV